MLSDSTCPSSPRPLTNCELPPAALLLYCKHTVHHRCWEPSLMLIFLIFPGLFAALEGKLATALCFSFTISRQLMAKTCSRWSRKGRAPLLLHFLRKLQLLSALLHSVSSYHVTWALHPQCCRSAEKRSREWRRTAVRSRDMLLGQQ